MQTARGLAASACLGAGASRCEAVQHPDRRHCRARVADRFRIGRAVDDASITRTGVIAGTPQYMSPEQARGANVDARSDLFSLGSVLYFISTGRQPFSRRQ